MPTLNNPSFPENLKETVDNEHCLLDVENRADDAFDFGQRAQWLRAAVLGANDGLVSTVSLMMGVGAVKQDMHAMILVSFAGLVAGSCSMAIGEYVSVYSQLDIELAQLKRENSDQNDGKFLPNPLQAALASALAFAVGAIIPLLTAACIRNYRVRLGLVSVVASLALILFGGMGAFLGKAPMKKSCLRVLLGGWLAMSITFGLTKIMATNGLQ